VAIVGGFKEIITGPTSFDKLVSTYDWWGPSRALTVENPSKEVAPITEFPFWTFLFADLHAHLMAIPFSMTAAGGLRHHEFHAAQPCWRGARSAGARSAAGRYRRCADRRAVRSTRGTTAVPPAGRGGAIIGGRAKE
jgi:hypothetical protein